ncbi:unnamed protein product [Rhizophagus irregularis]|nr:unnamed protein product [Rhizophagus irregularis]
MGGRSYKEVNVGVTDDKIVEMVNKFCKGTLEVRCEVVEEYCNRGTVQEDNKMQTVGLKKDNVFPEEVVKIINNLYKEPQQHTHYKPHLMKNRSHQLVSIFKNSGGSDEAME